MLKLPLTDSVPLQLDWSVNIPYSLWHSHVLLWCFDRQRKQSRDVNKQRYCSTPLQISLAAESEVHSIGYCTQSLERLAKWASIWAMFSRTSVPKQQSARWSFTAGLATRKFPAFSCLALLSSVFRRPVCRSKYSVTAVRKLYVLFCLIVAAPAWM